MKEDVFTKAGMAALLPGMRFLRDKMAEEIQTLEALLSTPYMGAKRGRPRKVFSEVEDEQHEPRQAAQKVRTNNPIRDWWAKMTPEQRSAEMKRRMRVHLGEAPHLTHRTKAAKKKTPTHGAAVPAPRDKDGWYPVNMAARIMGLRDTQIRGMILTGKLKARKQAAPGKTRLIHYLNPTDVEKYSKGSKP